MRWAELRLPVDIAFFFHHSGDGPRRRVLPEPDGADRVAAELDAWEEIERANPVLARSSPTCEALLVNRVARRAASTRSCRSTTCTALVGADPHALARLHRRREVWQEIEAFFAGLDRRARGERADEAAWASGRASPTSPGCATHTKGIIGQLEGQLREMTGHKPDGRVDGGALDGVNAGQREPIDPRMPNLPPA